MSRLTVAEWLRLPLTPVIVKVRVPLVACLVVNTLRIEVPDPATPVGLKLPVTRESSPATLRFTVPVNPFTALMVTV